MGTNYSGEANCGGIIPQVMETIFKKIAAMKDTAEILLRVSFIEVSPQFCLWLEAFEYFCATKHYLRVLHATFSSELTPSITSLIFPFH